jgi:hypothetical protein
VTGRVGNALDREDHTELVVALSADLKTQIAAVRSELSAHVQVDQLQFQTVTEKLRDVSQAMNRISWAGWPIAGGVLVLLAKAFHLIQ